MAVWRLWIRLSDYGQQDGTFVDMFDGSTGLKFSISYILDKECCFMYLNIEISKIPLKATYTNWAPDQPNTVGPSYAYINLRDGLWYDEIGTATGHGLCELRGETSYLDRGDLDDDIGRFS